MEEIAIWYESFLPVEALDFVIVGELAIASASDDGEVIATIGKSVAEAGDGKRLEDVDLREILIRKSAQVPAAWVNPALGLLAVENRYVNFEELIYGRLHRRIDAIYDQLDTNFCAHEIQDLFSGRLEYLLESSGDPGAKKMRNIGEVAMAFAGGFARGWFGVPGVAGAAAKAAQWLFEAEDAVTEPIVTAAKVLTLFELLPGSSDASLTPEEASLRSFAERQTRAFAAQGSSAAGDSYRAWHATFQLLGGRSDSDDAVMPDLVGDTYEEAVERLEESGVTVAGYVDMAQGSDRVMWLESNWVVVAQLPEAGMTIPDDRLAFLAVKKPGERARHHAKRKLTERVPELRARFEYRDG